MSSPTRSEAALPDSSRRSARARRRTIFWAGYLWVLPALAAYLTFVIVPLFQTVRYSLYDWDGIGVATFAGLSNYGLVFSDPELAGSIVHALILIVFFSFLPVALSLLVASVLRDVKSRAGTSVAQTILFIPQVLPLVASGIAWTWMYSTSGPINQAFGALGMAWAQHDWLGDFGTALPAVGLIGTWVALGFCVVLLTSGIGKIDPALYEATSLDGAGWFQQLRYVTLPGLRQEVIICLTLTVISALSSFDLIYVTTKGGPGYETLVPGVEIYRLVFTDNKVGLGSALAVVLTAMVLIVVFLLQRLRGKDDEV
jgi:raffinose/stachyose/melibiose transport system permease protein